MNAIVSVDGLRKSYGATAAVDGVSFEVREGEIFGLIGPNGAGKTTTIEILEGLRRPDAGAIRVLGLDPQHEGKRLRMHVGMQLQSSNLQDRLKVWEALNLYASFYPTPVDWRELLVQLGLEEKRDTAFAKLSGGQKQRLFIALALLLDPQLIFLDELTTGLDPQARHTIWDLIRDVRARGKTVVLTTHFMEEAEHLCDRVGILNHGRFVAQDTPEALIRGLAAAQRVSFAVTGGPPVALQAALSQVGRVKVEGDEVTVTGQDGRADPLVSEVVGLLAAQDVAFRDLRTEQATLEDVFLKMTAGA